MENIIGIEEDIVLDNDIVNITHINNLDIWDEDEFIRRFRVSKRTTADILEQIEHLLTHRSNRNQAVSPLQQLLLTLRFFATGSFYITVADFGGVHKSTVGKIVQRVVHALATLRPNYIHFPDTAEEKEAVAIKFYRIARFPRVLGAVDCTHIKLQSPDFNTDPTLLKTSETAKDIFSLNIQVVCNADNQIIDIVARWPGASHDSYIFNNSAIKAKFERGDMNSFVLLGDSGYPLRSYLLTPLENTNNPAQNLYNEAQIRTRNVVERTFGIWKRRFPILSIGIRTKVPLAQTIVIATAIIHNIACKNNDIVPENEEQAVDNFPNIPHEQNDQRGIAILSYVLWLHIWIEGLHYYDLH
ncbi:hypothetical protein NQ315_008231 [Exocentrus adspersus]|uniref:Putative nuclease HARBI1 n=1 Tax=Exocentrus adspersus TaxID=1586481 RepID=A0AAV8VMW2_9CUCU|nr:hypothetical protein NQ315_008231 [Exocentrus adspersus]